MNDQYDPSEWDDNESYTEEDLLGNIVLTLFFLSVFCIIGLLVWAALK